MFFFRYESLYSFEKAFRKNSVVQENLWNYLDIRQIPSDDEIRYILGSIPTSAINKLIRKIQRRIEKKKYFQRCLFLEQYYLVALDGSGQISSYKIKCDECLTREYETGAVLYMHQNLLASLITENSQFSMTLAYEPITNIDGKTEFDKNDCEITAVKRLIPKIRNLYPKRKFCFNADNLMAVVPIVKLLSEYNYHYIFTVKPSRNKELFDWLNYLKEQQQSYSFIDNNGHRHVYTWSNKLPLRQENKEEKFFNVNFIEYFEYNKNKKQVYHSSWVTDFIISRNNVVRIAKGGRSRFTIENRSFNEQKNLGFAAEHNFGHKDNCPSVFYGLMQIGHLFSQLFTLWNEGKRLCKEKGSIIAFFESLKVLFHNIPLPESKKIIWYIKFPLDTS